MFKPLPDRGDQEPGTRVEVDGEVFEVRARRDRPGHYHFAWVSGPNPGYGFGVGTSDGQEMSTTEIEMSIRNFLGSIDPGTGYFE